MKKSLHIIAIVFGFIFSLAAGINPDEKVVIIKEDFASVTVSAEFAQFFSSAEYNKQTKSFDFKSHSDISFVQIFNSEGELEFQLPVMENNVKIKQSFFDIGSYKLGFMLDKRDDVLFTDLMMN